MLNFKNLFNKSNKLKIIKYDEQGKITLEYLKNILRYEPNTGNWYWLIDIRNKVQKGDKAGSIDSNGYVLIRIANKSYRAHVIAWFYMTGEWPNKQIDHKDTVRSNNTYINLRPATQSQQKANSNLPANNTSGFKGVCWAKQYKKWRVRIQINGSVLNLGYFMDLIKAAKTYDIYYLKYFGEYARLNFPELKEQYLSELNNENLLRSTL